MVFFFFFFFFPRASLPLLPLHFQQETLPPLQGPLGSLLTLQNNVPNWELVSAFISISKLTCPASHPLGVCLIATSSRTNSSRAGQHQPRETLGRRLLACLGPAAGSGCVGAVQCPGHSGPSQSRPILPGVRSLGPSPCSVSHFVFLLCGPLGVSAPHLSTGLRDLLVP